MQTLNQLSGQVPRETTNYTDDNQVSGIPLSEAKHLFETRILYEPNIDGESNAPAANGMEVAPYGQSESVLTVTPTRVDIGKDELMRNGQTKGGEPDGWPMKPEELLANSSSKKGGARTFLPLKGMLRWSWIDQGHSTSLAEQAGRCRSCFVGT